MLSKQNRVSKELFDELLKKGKVLHSPLFSLRYVVADEIGGRTGFVTPSGTFEKGNVSEMFKHPDGVTNPVRPTTTTPRFAFVVSKKIAPNAVDRNKLRRRGYSATRQFLPLHKPIIGAFFFKKEAKGAKFPAMKNEIEGLLKRAGVA